MSYAYDLRHWATVAEFDTHLHRHDPIATAPWARGVVLHHTWRPLPSQWNGAITMNAMSNRGMKRWAGEADRICSWSLADGIRNSTASGKCVH
jgi:hypothetical protein